MFTPKSSQSLYCPGKCRDKAKKDYNRKYMREWCKNNPDKVRMYKKKWMDDNPERHRENYLKWCAENPDRVREYAKERNKRLGGGGYRRQWKRLMKEHGPICGICGFTLNYSDDHISGYDFHVDHVIPIDKGGTNDYDNLQLAHPDCNLVKSNQ